jgi:hypothetical protein
VVEERLAVMTPWRYFVESGPEREIRRREERFAYAALGGGGGFLFEEYARFERAAGEVERKERERQLVQMYGRERGLSREIVCGDFIVVLGIVGGEY